MKKMFSIAACLFGFSLNIMGMNNSVSAAELAGYFQDHCVHKLRIITGSPTSVSCVDRHPTPEVDGHPTPEIGSPTLKLQAFSPIRNHRTPPLDTPPTSPTDSHEKCPTPKARLSALILAFQEQAA